MYTNKSTFKKLSSYSQYLEVRTHKTFQQTEANLRLEDTYLIQRKAIKLLYNIKVKVRSQCRVSFRLSYNPDFKQSDD